MSIATASGLEIAPPRPLLLTPLITPQGLLALADWLFWDWPPAIGVSLALFLGALGVIAVASQSRVSEDAGTIRSS